MQQNAYAFHYRIQPLTIEDPKILIDNLNEINKLEKLHIDWKFLENIAFYCKVGMDVYNKKEQRPWHNAFSVLEGAQKESETLLQRVVAILRGVVKSQALGCFWVVSRDYGRLFNAQIAMDHDNPILVETRNKMVKGSSEEKICGAMGFGFKLAFAGDTYLRFVVGDGGDMSLYRKA